MFPDGLTYLLWVLLRAQGAGAIIAEMALLGQGWMTMRRSRINIHSRKAAPDADQSAVEL